LSLAGSSDHKVLVEAQYQYSACGSCWVGTNLLADGNAVCSPTSGLWKGAGNSFSIPETRSISCVVQVSAGDHSFSLQASGSANTHLNSVELSAVDLGPAS
jgi:hypothetical protein